MFRYPQSEGRGKDHQHFTYDFEWGVTLRRSPLLSHEGKTVLSQPLRVVFRLVCMGRPEIRGVGVTHSGDFSLRILRFQNNIVWVLYTLYGLLVNSMNLGRLSVELTLFG